MVKHGVDSAARVPSNHFWIRITVTNSFPLHGTYCADGSINLDQSIPYGRTLVPVRVERGDTRVSRWPSKGHLHGLKNGINNGINNGCFFEERDGWLFRGSCKYIYRQ